MAMGKRRRHAKQASMWVATQDLPRSVAHPFYTRLNQILDKADFAGYVESLCQRFYADELGRPGLPPGRYFRLLLLGCFEGLDSERTIAWRAADSERCFSISGRCRCGRGDHCQGTPMASEERAQHGSRVREMAGRRSVRWVSSRDRPFVARTTKKTRILVQPEPGGCSMQPRFGG
jgi:hypothetical protein